MTISFVTQHSDYWIAPYFLHTLHILSPSHPRPGTEERSEDPNRCARVGVADGRQHPPSSSARCEPSRGCCAHKPCPFRCVPRYSSLPIIFCEAPVLPWWLWLLLLFTLFFNLGQAWSHLGPNVCPQREKMGKTQQEQALRQASMI